MSGRAAEFYGANDVDALFKGSPKTTAPWAMAPKSRTHRMDNPQQVREAVANPDRYQTEALDPRDLYASQSEIIRPAVQHYMNGDHHATGETYADQHQAGNAQPVVFRDLDSGRNIIRSGHHRATTALLRGEQFEALVVPGHRSTHAEAVEYQRSLHQGR